VLADLGEVTVDRDLACRAPDGTPLRTDVYRPAGTGDRPALLLRLPYGKTAADSDVAFAHPAWLAGQGFVVAVQDVRGRWASGGDFCPFRDEAADGQAAVEWTAGLDGCDGRVITYGFSYPGLIQLLTAARRPRGLAAICPAFTASQAYDGWAYQGGALSGFVVEWAVELALDGARRAGDYRSFRALRTQLATGSAWYEAPAGGPAEPGGAGPDATLARAVSAYSGWLDDWCAQPAGGDFWADWDAGTRYPQIDVPALHVGGWWDHFARGTVRNFRGLRAGAASASARAGQRLVLGPWRHMPWSPVGEPAGAVDGPGAPALPSGTDVVDLHLQWWRQVLYGEAAPLLDAPVRAWVSGLGWRELDDWPGAGPAVPLYLHSGGRAATRFGDGSLSRRAPESGFPDVLAYDPWMALPRDGGHGCCLAGVSPMGPACQCAAEESPTVLVYTSAPLPGPLVLTGDVSAEIWVSTDAPSADVCARLCLVDREGCSVNLLEGVRRIGLAPGPVRVRVDLGPVGRLIEAGERLRLHISGSDHPLWDLNLATGEAWSPCRASFGGTATQVIFHDTAHPSALFLPVADGAPA
jgi:putative CocE/NonD family hydrolase